MRSAISDRFSICDFAVLLQKIILNTEVCTARPMSRLAFIFHWANIADLAAIMPVRLEIRRSGSMKASGAHVSLLSSEVLFPVLPLLSQSRATITSRSELHEFDSLHVTTAK